MGRWTRLFFCFGDSVDNPSDEDFRRALAELFKLGNSEHPDSWLECGTDGGKMETMSIFSSGYAVHKIYSDSDMTEEISSKRIENITEENGVDLWQTMISKNEGWNR